MRLRVRKHLFILDLYDNLYMEMDGRHNLSNYQICGRLFNRFRTLPIYVWKQFNHFLSLLFFLFRRFASNCASRTFQSIGFDQSFSLHWGGDIQAMHANDYRNRFESKTWITSYWWAVVETTYSWRKKIEKADYADSIS